MGFVDNTLQKESTRVVPLSNCGNSEGKSRTLPMENGNNDSYGGLPKYKRRRVSAVRDFPPGCGRHAPIVSLGLNDEAAGVGIVENSSERERNNDVGDFLIPSGKGVDSKLVMARENLPSTMIPMQPNHMESKLENVLNSNNIGPIIMPLPEVLETLSNGGDIEPLKSLKRKTIDMPNDFHKDVIAPRECIIPPKYPPRRRISAVRDFPPFCGRNAAHLIRENANVLAYLEGKNLGQVKGGIGEELVSLVVREKDAQNEDNDVEKMGENVQNENDHEHQLEMKVSIPSGLDVHFEPEGQTSEDRRNQDEFGASSKNEVKAVAQDLLEQSIKSPNERIHSQWERRPHKSHTTLELGKACIKPPVDIEGLQLSIDKEVVMGLKAAGNGSQMDHKRVHKPNQPSSCTNERKQRNDFILQDQPETSIKTKKNGMESTRGINMNENKTKKKKNQGMEMIPCNSKDNVEHGGEFDKFQLVRRSHDVDVTLPPACPINSIGRSDGNDGFVTRSKVRETLRLFQVVYRKLVKKDESELKRIKRPDIEASIVLKNKGMFINTNKIIGPVPGVEVGDEFQYRVELNIIGLHRQIQGGIDYVKEHGRMLATSIVASGGYDDDLDDSDVLIYTGSGGNMMKGKEPEDQKLERGNLALKNSINAKNPVRVIRGDMRVSESSSAKMRTYVYDGLYLVEKYWQELGSHNKLVFKFRLVRIPDQPELAWKVVKKCKKFEVREGLCVDDISQGKELIPICAVNTIDDEKPSAFKYITHVRYPDWFNLNPPIGCDCTKRCSENGKCSCVVRNQGEIPYNHNGAVVQAKPLVYECGPSCKCPSSCYNRVTQHGIKFELEIFKTESRGWGVRSLNSIPSGSFICEYVGELLKEKEAEERMGNDEYLFDIGNSYNDSSLWDGVSNLLETHSSSHGVAEESCFTIDAAKYGNVGRFVNHSCSPNLYAQNVLYDHEDTRVPHIMFFAMENIPPLQELTYHYNYTIDQVRDSDGNIKKKSCYCGSSECTGRMY